MKYFGIFVIIVAISISIVAAYFSIDGFIALFAAAFIPVMIMGIILEIGKLTATAWLHLHWHDKTKSFIHKLYLGIAVILLMVVTATGVYGFLSKGHLEASSPRENLTLEIALKENEIKILTQENYNLQTQINTMTKNLEVFLQAGKATAAAETARKTKAERDSLLAKQKENNEEIKKLNEELLPLKTANVAVETKLGPIKYVAELFGIENPEAAIRILIVMIVITFDPLAVMLLIAGIHSIEQANRKKDNETNQNSNELLTNLQIENNKILNDFNNLKGDIVKYEQTIDSLQKILHEEQNKEKIPNDILDKVNDLNFEIHKLKNQNELLEIELGNKSFKNSELLSQIEFMQQTLDEIKQKETFDKLPKEQIVEILSKNPEIVDDIIQLVCQMTKQKTEEKVKAEPNWLDGTTMKYL